MTDLILCTTEDGRSQIELRSDQQTVWLTQLEMAELFDATKQNISLHLKNLFEDGGLSENSVVKESLTTVADSKRYLMQIYNLDAILAMGYRVRSPRGVKFRRWASIVLKMNDNDEKQLGRTFWSIADRARFSRLRAVLPLRHRHPRQPGTCGQ